MQAVILLASEDSGVTPSREGIVREFGGVLVEFSKNHYSQNGEDGIIEEILKRLDIHDGWFVEFGAWDGRFLSNTFHLLEQGSWRGVSIEANAERYKDLLQTKAQFPERLTAMCAYVEPDGDNRLDSLLKRTSIPSDFELLSIDVDSFDWHIWHSLVEYHPKVVIIESNTTLLPGVHQVHTPGGAAEGSSFSSILELGQHKGYTLVCSTGNMFFVRNDLVEKIQMKPIFVEFPYLLFSYAKRRQELAYQHGVKRMVKRTIGRFLPEYLRNQLRRAGRTLLPG